MSKRRRVVVVLLAAVFSTTAYAQQTLNLRVISWNMESGDSNATTLAGQMAEKQNVDIWGLSEVRPTAASTFRDGAANNGGDFRLIRGNTGNDDRLAVIYNNDKLERLATQELTDIQLGRSGLRAPLVVHFRTRTGSVEFLFMVNHLLRGDANDDEDQEDRVTQGRMLNEWAADQVLPAILVGDYNADWDVNDGDSGDRAPLFDELIHDGHLTWIRPVTLLRTQHEYNSVLDFVFVANQSALPGLSGASRILNRSGDSVATTATYSDNQFETDHRPVDATFTFTVSGPGPEHIRTIQPIGPLTMRAREVMPRRAVSGAPSGGLELSGRMFRRESRADTVRDSHAQPDLNDVVRRLERIEKQLADLQAVFGDDDSDDSGE